jgi:hypothetical protein
MNRKILEACPSCGADLEIREVGCVRCGTQVRARYRPCDFCRLSDEQSTFLRLFVTSRGNLSEVEKRLGVSYPTVRAKLDEIIGRLTAGDGARAESRAEETPPGGAARREILQAVARGELDPAEGVRRLRELGEA